MNNIDSRGSESSDKEKHSKKWVKNLVGLYKNYGMIIGIFIAVVTGTAGLTTFFMKK